jgi:hypothetical protein
MNDQGQTECTACKARISSLLGGRIDGLRLLIRDDGIILQGRSRTYHAKQLALQAVMEATELPIVANEIVVR